jgi:hypothetical protein
MKKRFLILGDILAIALVTILGFATHGETGLSFLPRMAAFFIPLVISWFLLAPALGLFHQEIVTSPRQLWRPVLAMSFAAPFAALLRGLILNSPVIPIFGVVLILTSGFGILVWRAIYLFLNRRLGGGA